MKKLSVLLILLLTAFLLFSACKTDVKDSDISQNKNIFYVEALPDIGDFSGNRASEMFDENVTDDFEPSDEYGEIIPYIGSYRVFETPKSQWDDWHTEMGYSTYGFCTPDGRIVMRASDKNTYLNYRNTDDGFGFYTVNREQLPVDDAPDEFMPSEVFIIPRDGSWCLKLPRGSWVTNAGGGYIGICEYPEDGSVRTLLYNYDGELVRTIEGVDNVGVLSSGLMMVSSWVQGGYSACFINEYGETVLGPYSSASDFNKYGITAVEDENGAYLVNTKGERLTEYYDSFYKEFSDDMSKTLFVARKESIKNVCDVFDEKGEFLGAVEGASYFSTRFPDNGDIYYFYTQYDNNDKGYPIYNSERMIFRNLRTGEDFVSKEFGIGPNSYSGTDNCFIHIDEEQKKAVIFDTNGNTVSVIEGASQVVNTSEYGEYVIYIEGEYNYDINPETNKPYEDTRKTHIYDSKNNKTVYTLDAMGNAHFADKDKRFVLITSYDETDLFGGYSSSWLFDTRTGKTVFEDCNEIALYEVGDKVYINVCTDNSSALYDEDFNVIRKAYFE